MNVVIDQLGANAIVPVVTLDDADKAPALARALSAGDLPCAEITFRTAAAADGIRRMLDTCPDMCVGAGTILTVDQAEEARAAGANFVVTPGFDSVIVEWCRAADLPIVPGVMTPTEINLALNAGVDLVKFFPAEVAGGVDALRAIAGPYAGMRFMPTGGVDADNVAAYLNLPMVHACGGSWIASSDLLANSDFATIKKRAHRAVEIVKTARPKAGP